MTPSWRTSVERIGLAGIAIATAAVVILHSPIHAGAEAGRKLEILVDYDRACGNQDGRARYRLEESGDHADIKVRSKSYWNASRLILESGVRYRFESAENATWNDLDHVVDVAGWWPEGGWQAWFMAVARPLLRAPDQKLFQLMGLIYRRCGDANRGCATQFPIGKEGYTFTPAVGGEFCAYANDLPFTYGNNSGEITLRITRE